MDDSLDLTEAEEFLEEADAEEMMDDDLQTGEDSGQVEQAQPPAGNTASQPSQPQPANVPAAANSTSGVPAVQSGHYEPPKLLKLVTVALLLKRMDDEDQVQSILERFDQEDAGTVIKYMYANNLEREVDPAVTMKFLDELAEKLPQATEVNKKRVIQRVQHVVSTVGKNRMEKKLQLERHKVSQFVFNAVEGEYYEISTRIANIIATYLESGV